MQTNVLIEFANIQITGKANIQITGREVISKLQEERGYLGERGEWGVEVCA